MIPREYWKSIICLIMAVAFQGVSLWQMEIVDRNILVDLFTFDMPFYILSPMNIWVARDFWHLINWIGFTLGIISAATFIVKRTELKHEKLLRSEAG